MSTAYTGWNLFGESISKLKKVMNISKHVLTRKPKDSHGLHIYGTQRNYYPCELLWHDIMAFLILLFEVSCCMRYTQFHAGNLRYSSTAQPFNGLVAC